MRGKSKNGPRIVFWAVYCFLLSAAASAVDYIPPFHIPSARFNAMGGVHAAVADDFSVLFSNPAGFANSKEEFSAAELTFSLYGPVFDMIDSIRAYTDSGSLDLSGIVGPRGLRTGLGVTGPVSFGWVGRGLGFGFFNRTAFDASAAGMDLSAAASEEFLMLGGYSFRLAFPGSHLLDAGFLAKGYLRGSVLMSASIFSVTSLVDGSNPLETKPFVSTAGIGFDLGMRYEWDRTIAAAVTCQDIYSPAIVSTYASMMDYVAGTSPTDSGSYATIKPRLNAGVLYSPRFPVLERVFSKIQIMADYRDFLDLLEVIPRNPVLNVALGMEVVVLDALSLRAGIADALPNAGFGLDLTFMRIDFAMRGVEFGLDPGKNPNFAMDIGFLFRY